MLDAAKPLLIVGLGNPGASYAAHRHNIGFMVLDALAAKHAARWQEKFYSQTTVLSLPAGKVILLKPQTYMNLSGKAVLAAVQFYKLTPADVIVFHDDIDLEFGKCRLKVGGGHGGHNGLRDIDRALSPAYKRVRLGIGRPALKAQVHDYVLSAFLPEEQPWVASLCQTLSSTLPWLVSGDDDKVMNAVAAAWQATQKKE